MMKKHVYLLCLPILLLAGKSRSQSMDAALKAYSEQSQPEKIHIHFDKDAYIPGETIWLKAYLLSGSKPSELSKNIYFDWTDVNGRLLAHYIAPILESSATSSFILPLDFKGGSIHVKAYTQWMLNFDNEFLFNKNIPVLCLWDGSPQAPEKNYSTVQFFPESGDLVAGLNSVVAFESRDQHGRPVKVKGVIKNSSNVIIDSFWTQHDGMGSFKFQPLGAEKYTASWKDEFGETHATALPQVKFAGVVMNVSSAQENNFRFKIERTENGSENLKSLTLIATSFQQVVYRTTLDLNAKTGAEASFRANQLPTGSMQVTVFDANMSPLLERVVFVNNHQFSFPTQVKQDLVNLNKKGKNDLSIEIPEGSATNLSVSVTDAGLGYDSSNNIVADLLLNGDIRGNIINPAYYFSNNADSTRNHLDLVMLTHGWRRFKWEDLLAGKLPALKYAPDTEYMVFKGQINASNAHFDNYDSIALLMISKERKRNIISLPINSDGSFSQRGMFFYDSVQVVYRLNHPAKFGSNAEINFQTSLLGPTLPNSSAADPFFQWSRVPDVILEKEINGLLEELKNYSRQPKGLDYVITPRRLDSTRNNSETAAHYLEGNFPGFKFPYEPKEGNGTNADSRYASYQKNGQPVVAPRNNVNLELDGNPVTMDDLKQLRMREVLFIKMMQKNSSKDLPTLALTSRQSLEQNNILNNKTGFAVIKGYTAAKEFYVPQYHENAQDDQVSGDYRSTLYWNPRVILDKDHHKVTISFFNNDVSSRLRVIVEGINKDGKLTRVDQIIK